MTYVPGQGLEIVTTGHKGHLLFCLRQRSPDIGSHRPFTKNGHAYMHLSKIRRDRVRPYDSELFLHIDLYRMDTHLQVWENRPRTL